MLVKMKQKTGWPVVAALSCLALAACVRSPDTPAPVAAGAALPQPSQAAVPAEPAAPTASVPLPFATVPMALRCEQAERPIADQFGNNHDAVYLPGQAGSKWRHYLVISGVGGIGQLYGSQQLTADASGWTLLDDDYTVAPHYELDDGLLIDGTYYIFEGRSIYAFSGELEGSSGQWVQAGRVPAYIDDIGVYFDGETVHAYGEYGRFAHGHDGVSIAYVRTDPSFQDWELVSTSIANPNTLPGAEWGVGDPTLLVHNGRILMITDIEALGIPYRMALWESEGFDRNFDFAGILATPRPGTADYNNYRVQDGEFAIEGNGDIFLFANWMDTDGNPGQSLPNFSAGWTRLVGGYSCALQ